MKTCAKCNKTLPLSAFKRLLTLAETKARGKDGNRRMVVESKNCRACQPKRKPPRKLTRKELVSRATSGDLHPTRAKLILAKRAADLNAKKSHGRRQAWDDLRAKLWTTLVLAPLSLEIERVAAKRSAARPESKYPDADIYALWDSYHAMLHDLRTDIKARRFKGEALPKHLTEHIKSQWLDNELALHGVARHPTTEDLMAYFTAITSTKPTPETKWAHALWTLVLTEQQRTAISQLWQAVPLHKRGRLSTPTALVNIDTSA